MSEGKKLELPLVDHLTQDELRVLVTVELLKRQGVLDTEAFITENELAVKLNFRTGLGVSAVVLKAESREAKSKPTKLAKEDVI